ncbi:MAG: decaprenyl-phosphate phosphoribosyltransferase [Planctomycetota bacterium]
MSSIAAYIRLIRPAHWVKNGFVFAPLLFAGRFNDPAALLQALAAFAGFCAMASAVYVVNDILDRERDRRHPVKRLRPIAAGTISIATAAVMAIVLAAAGLGLAAAGVAAEGRTACLLILGLYLAVNLAYSARLKHVVILDVFLVSAGFVLRVVAGGAATGIPNSEWMLICTILLALFLGFAKRRHELVLMGGEAAGHRGILAEYSIDLLDRIIGVITACTVMAYMLYTISDQTKAKLGGSSALLYTVVFVMYGVFRYLFLVYRKDEGGSPTRLLLTDLQLMVTVLLWAVTCGLIVFRYHGG